MTDIVLRLRAVDGFDLVADTCHEAADEIERLREELKHAHALVDTLRKAIGVTGWTPSAALGEGEE
jgi:hypothetical protein